MQKVNEKGKKAKKADDWMYIRWIIREQQKVTSPTANENNNNNTLARWNATENYAII